MGLVGFGVFFGCGLYCVWFDLLWVLRLVGCFVLIVTLVWVGLYAWLLWVWRCGSCSGFGGFSGMSLAC